jgi:circadian clock protein KaiC
MTRLVDFLKMAQVTLCMTALSEGGESVEVTGVNISSLVDTWLLLRNEEINGNRLRTLSIVKARGMAHSNKAQEFEMSAKGIEFKHETTARRKQ